MVPLNLLFEKSAYSMSGLLRTPICVVDGTCKLVVRPEVGFWGFTFHGARQFSASHVISFPLWQKAKAVLDRVGVQQLQQQGRQAAL